MKNYFLGLIILLISCKHLSYPTEANIENELNSYVNGYIGNDQTIFSNVQIESTVDTTVLGENTYMVFFSANQFRKKYADNYLFHSLIYYSKVDSGWKASNVPNIVSHVQKSADLVLFYKSMKSTIH
jgi:hypothetical protein